MNTSTVPLELLQRYNVPGPRYTSYPTAPVWKEEFRPADYESLLAASAESPDPAPLSLYVHLPFCESLCYFCACTVVITRNHSVELPYLDALEREIEWVAARAGAGRPVVQLQWGGGTPSYLSSENMGRLCGRLRRFFSFAEDAEMGIEVDPRVTSEEQLETLRRAGFNRVSLGVQDFEPRVQKAINRSQSAAATRRLVETARQLGFSSVNMDLIYGLPFQTPESFARTIDAILEIHPDRLAVYSYANVPWLKKHQVLLEKHLPGEKTKFEIFRLALERLTAGGYEYIGMDHFALPEDELARARRQRTLHRNFMGYTTKAGTDLIGLGMSAIGSVGNAYVQNRRELHEYQSSVGSAGVAVFRGFRLSADDRIRRTVIGNLLCHGVVVKKEIEASFDLSFDLYFAEALERLEPCAEDGLVELAAEQVRATPLGRIFLRNLAMPFDAYLSPAASERPAFSRTL